MMDLNLSELQAELLSSLDRFLSRESTIARVRSSEATGFDSPLWNGLVAMSAHSIGLPAAHGGIDGSLLDLALCSELYGKYLTPAPALESAVVGRLLARCDTPFARLLLSAVVDGKPIAIALTPLAQSRRQLVRSASLTRTIIALEGDEIVAFESPNPIRRMENMASDPSAIVDFSGSFERRVIKHAAQPLFAHALAEWKVLMAAMFSGLGDEAIRIGSGYAKERTAFGRPIGSYQAVAHRLADAATAIEGARLISRTAADAATKRPERFATLASMAFIWASTSAQRAAADALHVHGGYGFTLEYDIQLYLRRAKAWSLALHDLRKEYQQVASDLFDKPEGIRTWIFS